MAPLQELGSTTTLLNFSASLLKALGQMLAGLAAQRGCGQDGVIGDDVYWLQWTPAPWRAVRVKTTV